ncbi:MAG: LamG domain-containing protein, partial [Victivallales bacterium]|nr:LamG domain-containing protein [Victivallales bacterium]
MKKVTSRILGCALAVFCGGAALMGSECRWNFDDGANALKCSEAGAKATGYHTMADGIVGKGIHFNGESHFMEITLPPELYPKSEMTVSFWFKAEEGSACFPALRHRNTHFSMSGGRGFSWYEVTGTKKRFYDGYGHPRELAYDTWYHLAMTYSQNELALYLDGVKIRSVQAKDGGDVKPGGTIMVGGRLSRSNDKWLNFKGTMDELEISTTVRTNWDWVKVLKLRENLRGFKALIKDSGWQKKFQAFENGIAQNGEANAGKLLKQGESLLMDGRIAYYCESSPATADAGFAAVAVNAMRRVMPGDILLDAPVKSVVMDMAANERENMQLLIYPTAFDFEGFSVKLPKELTGPDGKKHAFKVALFETEYTPIEKPSHWMYNYPAIPDRLLPRDYFNVPADGCTPLWLDVRSLPGTPAGCYKGALTVVGSNGAECDIPLEVNVRSFGLPERNTVPSCIGLWERDIQTFVKQGDAEHFTNLVGAYGEMLVEHRLNPVIFSNAHLVASWVRDQVYPVAKIGADGTATVNWTYYDRIIEQLRAKGLSNIFIGPNYANPQHWAKEKGAAPATFKAVAEHVKAKGWTDDAVAYPIDEWQHTEKNAMNELGRIIKENAPGISWLITGGSQNYPLDGVENVDIWVPQFHWVNSGAMKAAQRKGTPVWSYVCTGPQFPTPNLHIDSPPAAIRMVVAANFRFGFDGILH